MRKSALSSVLVAAAVIAPSLAFAGGFVHPDNGGEGIARSGAMTVSVDDASALYYNPANLAKLDGWSVVLAANFSFLDASFQRDGLDQRLIPDPDGTIPTVSFGERANTPFDKVERNCDEAALCTPLGFIAPMLFLGYGGEDWGAAIGAYAPPGLGTAEYPQEGPQRYSLIRQELALLWFSAGAGGQIGDFRIGASLLVGNLNVLFELMADANPSPLVNDTASANYTGESSDAYSQIFDLPFHLEASGWTAAGIVAAAWDILPELSLALTVQTQTEFKAPGKLEIDFDYTGAIPPNLATLSDDSVTLHTKQPWMVRFGVMWNYLVDEKPLFGLELNFLYESWSLVDKNVLSIPGTLGEGDGAQPIGDITLVKNWEDTFGMRFAGDYHPLDWLTLNIGVSMETGAVPEETTGLDNFSWNRLGVSGGLTFITPFGLDIAIGYAHLFQPERKVDNSIVRPTLALSQCAAPYDNTAACPSAGEPPGAPVGNGTYNASFDLFGLGLHYHY